MEAAYQYALGTVADAYEAEAVRHGGKSLSRVATIVVNSGSFFQRLREGKPFLVHNLDRFASWFRDPANWPMGTIPEDAAAALISIGRPPVDVSMTHSCGTNAADVPCDRMGISHKGAAA